MRQRRPLSLLAGLFDYTRREDGALTALNLFLVLGMSIISAFGVDYAKVLTARTLLQSTADAAAHAALLTRETGSEEEARLAALALVEDSMPAATFGTVVTENDIVFGRWDEVERKFAAQEGSRSAVLVRASRNTGRANGVATYFFRLVGLDNFDLTLDSVFLTYMPTCFREGFVANGVVDIQSNNSYFRGFCVHSNDHVSINSNNYFEKGTIVSMPDTTLLEMPISGAESNTGLIDALREGGFRMRLVARIPLIYNSLVAMKPKYMPDYITESSMDIKSGKTHDTTEFEKGHAYYLNCGDNGNVTINGTEPLNEVLIATDCEVKFGQGVQLIDVVFVNASTSAKSFNSPSSLILGRIDECAPGGGVQIVTMGGVSFTSDLSLHGTQILAAGDIEFSANADGVRGASMIAGGRIDGTSNMDMSFCNTGMEDNFEALYFRMGF